MTRYTSATDADREQMLAAIGVAPIDELFADVPEGVRLDRPLELPDGMSETEVYDGSPALAARNTQRRAARSPSSARACTTTTCRRSSTRSRSARSSSPPTRPTSRRSRRAPCRRCSSSRPRSRELTGLPVANASLYEGPSSVAAAAYLAKLETGRSRFVVSRGVHPHSRETLETYSAGFGTEVVEVPLADGATDADALERAVDDDTAAVFLQQPNFLGAIEDLEALAPVAKRTGALLVVVGRRARRSGVLRPPGDFGADVAVGEGQPLGNRLDFGGPSFGFFAAREEYIRRMPGRIAGRDDRRRRAARLRAHAPDARAAHPPREGDLQHLHEPGAERARGRDLPELARPAGDRRARRADGAAHRLCARAPGGARGRRAAARPDRSCASSRCRSTRRSTRCCGAAPSAASTRATRSARDYPGARGRPAGRDHRAPLARRTSTCSRTCSSAAVARRAQAGGGGSVITARRPTRRVPTPMQRDAAVTIFEKSSPGRRAAVLPDAGRSRAPARRADPEPPAAHRAAAAAGDLGARDRAPLQPHLAPQLRPRHGLLPARVVHDEAQPAAERARRGAAGPRAAASAARRRSGRRARSS